MRVALLLAAVAIWASVAYAQLPTCASVQLGTIYSNTTARSFTQLTSAGWTACYAQRFNVPMGATAAAAKAACAGYTHLLVACGVFGRSELITSSAAPASVIFNPVDFSSSGDDFGQARYYYTDTYNMGFLPAGGTTTRSQTVCDVTDSSSSERLCLHLSDLVGGGRCGDAERIGANSGNLRKVFMGECVHD